MDLLNQRIESNRLIQFPISHKYDDVLFHEFTENITKYMFPKSAETIADTMTFIEDSLIGLRNGEILQLVIIDKETKEFIGCSRLNNVRSINPELGIWVKDSSHGHGFGLEAINALILWANNNLNYQYLIYPVDKRNIASRRIPEKNNGIIAKEEKEINQSGFELDEVIYHIYKNNRREES